MSLRGKTLLFIGGGIETAPGLDLAKSSGISTVVLDGNPEAFCSNIADSFLTCDTYDVAGSVVTAEEFHTKHQKIDGVICMASDVPLTVATIANHLSLPGIPIRAAKTVSDKVLMKECFRDFDLPIPYFSELLDWNHLNSLCQEMDNDFVIKPVDSRGARGVIRLTPKTDLRWAFKTALAQSPSGRVMVEEFLYGPQVSTESLVINGEVFTLGFSDRNYEYLDKYAPYIIENGGDLPSFLTNEQQQKIRNAVSKTALALGIRNGVIKGDMVLSKEEAYIIEVAARLSGGYFCSHEIPLNTGVNFVLQAIKIALGEEVQINELKVEHNVPVCQRYLFPKPGRVIRLHIPGWIKDHANVELFELRVNKGDRIPKATSHPARAGVVITTGDTREDALTLANRVIEEVIIETG